MTQSARRTVVKFLIALATLSIGVFFAVQPTSLVNAATNCTVNSASCNNVCQLLDNCPTGLDGAASQNKDASRNSIITIINIIANTIIWIMVAISVFFIIYAGWMILSGGSDGVKEGQKILTNAFIGLAVAILSFLIVRYLVGFIDFLFTSAK